MVFEQISPWKPPFSHGVLTGHPSVLASFSNVSLIRVKEQKIKIDKFIRNKDMKQNRIRNEIKDGTYVENHPYY